MWKYGKKERAKKVGKPALTKTNTNTNLGREHTLALDRQQLGMTVIVSDLEWSEGFHVRPALRPAMTNAILVDMYSKRQKGRSDPMSRRTLNAIGK